MAEAKTAEKKQIGSAFDLLGKSWNIVKNNWQVFAAVNIFVILGAIANAFGVEDKNYDGSNNKYEAAGSFAGLGDGQIAAIVSAGIVIVLAVAIVGILLAVMATSLEVKAAAGKKPTLSELFEDGKKYFFRFIGLVILLAVIILSGLILLIVPGIFAIGRLVMAPFHMVDKDLGIMEAIRQSNAQAKGRMTKVYAAIGVTILIGILANIVGSVPVLGPLAAAVITIGFSLVLALRYQELKAAS